MGLLSFMAALIFFVGAVEMSSVPACAAVGMPGSSPSVSGQMHGPAADGEYPENALGTGSILGFHEMMFLQDVENQKRTRKIKRSMTAGEAFFVGNTKLNMAGSFSEIFGYTETASFRFSSNAFSRNDGSDNYSGTSREISKSEFVNTLKEGLHHVLKIDPRLNPFLWRHLLRASLGDYSFGLDARIGSTMYVSPKITWSRNLAGWPLVTELKWVPVLKSSNTNNKGSYVLFKCGTKF